MASTAPHSHHCAVLTEVHDCSERNEAKVYTSEGAPRMATADWKVASSDRDTGRQLMERSAIRNS
ncbi:hypothetical protein EYF80_047802 [Liparis tanakae]|uniref:Uncharacterized protein n=1 Tax=Liparis tanakae TaxID=230148 RepID=A0A4Z2FLL1_9TELE|nr:hypothetical protein EYF80_047802 [Liparis tanakae]